MKTKLRLTQKPCSWISILHIGAKGGLTIHRVLANILPVVPISFGSFTSLTIIVVVTVLVYRSSRQEKYVHSLLLPLAPLCSQGRTRFDYLTCQKSLILGLGLKVPGPSNVLVRAGVFVFLLLAILPLVLRFTLNWSGGTWCNPLPSYASMSSPCRRCTFGFIHNCIHSEVLKGRSIWRPCIACIAAVVTFHRVDWGLLEAKWWCSSKWLSVEGRSDFQFSVFRVWNFGSQFLGLYLWKGCGMSGIWIVCSCPWFFAMQLAIFKALSRQFTTGHSAGLSGLQCGCSMGVASD